MANPKKNQYLQNRQDLFSAGEEVGRQQVTDMFVHVLSDYSIMGNKKLRPEEIEKVVAETSTRLSYFWEAWTKSQEGDYKQEELDRDCVNPSLLSGSNRSLRGIRT